MSAGFPQIRGYRLLGQLGEGGMGRVYLGEDELLQRRVAIKMISPALAGEGEARARFLREARSMATVEHPHVVRVYALGETDGELYLVMEYVEGRTLADHLSSTPPLPLGDALRIVREVAQALAAAWARGIVHRDVKPANILLDGETHAKVTDFGLARAPVPGDGDLTGSGLIAGTPHYMAPEQVRGEACDFRSDVYSLGIVLWEMLGGEKPIKGQTAGEIIAHQLTDAVPPLRARRPDVPPEVDTLVQDMTAKAAQHRPPSYPDLMRRLANPADASGATATMARPAPRRASPPPRRFWPWLAAAGVVVVALLGGAWRYTHHPRGSFAVVVAPLHAPDPESDKEGRVLVSLLESELRKRLPEDDVDLVNADEVGKPVRSARGAKALGERYHADVVVWGEALAFGGEVAVASRIWRRDGTVLEDPDPPTLPGSSAGGAIESRRVRAAAVAERVAALYVKP